jgi:hypothetical protein
MGRLRPILSLGCALVAWGLPHEVEAADDLVMDFRPGELGSSSSPGYSFAEQHFREQLDDETANDPTTLKFDGKVVVNNEDAGSDPYNRTGRFERLVR